MRTINHAAILKGDRIVEGTGKARKVIPVESVSRWPESMCKAGTHVTSKALMVQGVPVTACYSESVDIQ